MYLKIIEQIAKSHPKTTLVVEELEVGESIFRELLVEADRKDGNCSIRFDVNSNGTIFGSGTSGAHNWYFTFSGREFCEYTPVNISKKFLDILYGNTPKCLRRL